MKFYKILTQIKHHLFIGLFGFTSYCKHTPTCSRYMVDSVKEDGLMGLLRGIKRIIFCY